MKAIIFALLGIALAENTLLLRRDLIEEVNSQGASWKAGINEKFIGMTVEEARSFLGLKTGGPSAPRDLDLNLQDLPESFDSRTEWPFCPFNILDQGKCGSCWAFGCAEALSDRYCIATNGSFHEDLSPQHLVSCDWEGNFGCNGGIPRLAWDFLEFSGLPTLSCLPYTSGKAGESGKCTKKCADGSPYPKSYKVKLLSVKAYKSEKEIQAAIREQGPVETGFQVYEDFMTYKSGVYHHVAGKLLGGHAVKIIGWGVEGTEKYWIVANSWGTGWGERGFFRIRRGTNECGFEKDAVAGKPAL